MKRYRLTPSARGDVIDILAYVQEQSPAGAMKVLRELRAAFVLIAARPGVGHRRDDLADETLRVWPVLSYLVIYRPRTRPVQIIRVLHGARDLSALLAPA